MADHRSERGRRAEPVWRSNWSAAWSRKNSMLLRRSICVMPSAMKCSSSTERASPGPVLFLAAPLRSLIVVEFCPIRSVARWKRLTVDQSRSSRSGSRRVAQRRDQCVEDVGDCSADGVGFWVVALGLPRPGRGGGRRVGVRRGRGRSKMRCAGFPKSVSSRSVMVKSSLSDRPRPSRPSWRSPDGGRTGTPHCRGAQRQRPKRRRMAGAGYFASRCKRRACPPTEK